MILNIINDNTCVWLTNLPKRTSYKTLTKDLNCDYLIIGSGFTGLSAARKLSELDNSKKITIVDAQLAGEGGSARNSGYLVDTTLNDGFTSNKDLQNYKIKTKIYDLGIKSIKKYIKEYQVDCDWNECGKYFASSKLEDETKANSFSNLLSELGYENKVLDNSELSNKLGTNFYKIAVYTKGGILLNPGKLVRSMIDTLPDNVQLIENAELISWKKNNETIECKFKNNIIKTIYKTKSRTIYL